MALAQLVRPPSVPRSTMPSRAVQRNAWPLPPTTSVRSLIPSAMLAAPSVPRSRMPSVAVHTNARGSPVLVSARPTAAPFSLRSWAMLVAPPSVPRSIIVPGSAIPKACFAGAPPPGAAAVSRNLPAPVDGERLALVSPQGAEIEARARGQQVGVKVAEPGVAAARDFAIVVDVVRRGVHAGERLQVDDPQGLFPQEGARAAQGVAARADDLTPAVHRFPLAHGTAQSAEVPDGDGD